MRESVSSLRRALDLLDAFDGSHWKLGLTDLSRRVGLPKATTHRFVMDLIDWGALERTPSGQLQLGIHLFELGQLVHVQRVMREVALPFLHDLYDLSLSTVNLAVRDGAEVVYLEKIPRGTEVKNSRAGGRLPMHCTALGKAILAFSPAPLVDDICASPLKVLTPKTITDPQHLRDELSMIRKTRVAIDGEESEAGLYCVGSPILGAHNSTAIGAISVSGIDSRAAARRLEPAVLAVAMAISRCMARSAGKS